jgi:hypothetical protein
VKPLQRADIKNQAIDGTICSEGHATLVRKSKMQPHPDDAGRGWERWVVRFDGDHTDDLYERIVTPEDLLPPGHGDGNRGEQDDGGGRPGAGSAAVRSEVRMLHTFESWLSVLAHAKAGKLLWYAGPLDVRACTVLVVRIYADQKRLKLNPGAGADSFVADEQHLSRFRYRK